jgi:hypothetical protein
VVRDDLLAARQAGVLDGWRESLCELTDAAEQRLATVSDVRMWDAVSRSIASAGQWQGLGGMQTLQAHGAQRRHAARR